MGELEGNEYDDGLDQYERVVRSQVMLGCEQVKEMEETLKLADPGCLSFTDCSNHAKAVREDLMGSAAAIVSNFSKLVTFLNSNISQRISNPAEIETIHRRIDHTDHMVRALREEEYEEATDVSCHNIGSPISTVRTSEAQYSSSPSPPPVNYDQRESLQINAQKQTSATKRRKLMPKRMLKLPVESSEPGGEMPPADGFTWRKYGQKYILGSRHPRSYYRCTYKRELGCPAIKYVQKSDEDPPVFNITLKGEHTCFISKNRCSSWPYTHPAHALAATSVQRVVYPTNAHSLTKSTTDFSQLNNSNPIPSSSIPDMRVLSMPFPPLSDLKVGSTRQYGNPGVASTSILSPEFITPKFGFYSCPVQSFQARDGAPDQSDAFGFSLVGNSGADILGDLVSSGKCSSNSSFQADENNMKDRWRELKNGCKSEITTELPNCISRPNTTEFIFSDIIDFFYHHPTGSAFESVDKKHPELLTSCKQLPSPETLSVLRDSLLSKTMQSTCMSAVPSIQNVAEESLHTSQTESIEIVAEHSPANTFSMCFEMGSSEAQQHIGGINFEPVSSTDPLLFY